MPPASVYAICRSLRTRSFSPTTRFAILPVHECLDFNSFRNDSWRTPGTELETAGRLEDSFGSARVFLERTLLCGDVARLADHVRHVGDCLRSFGDGARELQARIGDLTAAGRTERRI